MSRRSRADALVVMLDAHEKALVERLAYESGLSMSAWARMRLIGSTKAVTPIDNKFYECKPIERESK